jgi:membrane protein CcdC involved in cytochrome C biogenesis
MTQQEIESELRNLRALEEARRKNWRSVRRSAAFCGVLFALVGIGFEVVGLILTSSSSQSHVVQQAGGMFILLALPMIFLRNALIDPVLPG